MLLHAHGGSERRPVPQMEHDGGTLVRRRDGERAATSRGAARACTTRRAGLCSMQAVTVVKGSLPESTTPVSTFCLVERPGLQTLD